MIWKYLSQALRLTVVCIIAGMVLNFVYNTTAPIIKNYEEAEYKATLKKILPQATKFVEEGDYIIGYDDSSKVAGTILKGQARGYAGLIKILVGINEQKRIVGISIVQQQETPNLGTKIKEDKFLNQFIEKSYENLEEIDIITGATVSSKAVINGVKGALEKFGK